MSDKEKRKRSRTRKAVTIAAIALGAALLVMCGVFVYRTVINPGAAFTLPPKITPMPTEADAVSQERDEVRQNADESFMKDRVNILVMGMDASAERMETKREDFRTDTMLLVTVNFNTGKVDMITTPRDSYVEVTKATGELYKVNSAVYFGGGLCDSGFENACDTISGVFGGIPVPYYIGVDMDGMKALIDAMGGVDYDVDLSFTGDSGQVYEKGFQHLDSTQAMDYLRLRKGYGTDADRQARQRKMLISVFKQLADTGQIKNLPAIYQALSGMVYTNLTFEQICALAVFGAGFEDWENIGEYTLAGEYHTAYGVYYYLLDQQAKADLVKKVFGVAIGTDEKHDIHYVLGDKRNQDAGRETNPEDDEDEPDEPEAVPGNGDGGDKPEAVSGEGDGGDETEAVSGGGRETVKPDTSTQPDKSAPADPNTSVGTDASAAPDASTGVDAPGDVD